MTRPAIADRRLLDERAGLLVRGKQAFHFRAHCPFVTTGCVQKGRAIGRLALERAVEELLDPGPLIHHSDRDSSAYNHAFANVHSRPTVAGDMSITSAVSSIVKAAEKTQLDDPALLRVDGRETREHLVQREQIDIGRADKDDRVIERDGPLAGSALVGRMGARVIHENPAHRLGGDPEKMGPVLPADRTLIDQPDKGLVDERRRLQGVVGALAPQVAGRQPAQLGVDLRQEPVERVLPPIAPILQQPCDFGP